MSAYLERDLEEAERRDVDAHLAGCERCGAELQDLRQTVALLRRLPAPEPPPHLATRVLARIADGEARPAGWWSWLERLAAPVVAAPVAAALAAAAVVLLAEEPSPVRVAGAPPPMRIANAEPARVPERAIVPLRVGPAPAAVLFSASPPPPYALARRLRGAGHPHSRSLAAHFEHPADAVLASWQQR
jgi:anti-sigma factor RsiW